jgi:hypothetical protein
MKILSPMDDFRASTLAALPGALARLHYVAGLRQEGDGYHHWGLERAYGKAAAQATLAEAHSDMFLNVLRTPLRELWEEAYQSALKQGVELADFVTNLMEDVGRMVPRELRGGSSRHFNSVLRVLSSLAGLPEPKTRRAA